MSKVILVTGAGRGLGTDIAREALAAGHQVVATGRRPDEVEKTLGGPQDNLLVAKLDVTSPEDAESAAQAAVERFGRLDVLVNNAATNQPYGPLMDAAPEAWREAFTVNVEAPLRLVQCAWRSWMSEHGGTVINVCTEGAGHVGPNVGAYGTSKAALLHLTQQLAGELGPRVRVNSVSPGLVRTAMARFMWEPGEERIAAGLPLGRIGEPGDVARAVVWLASDEAEWVTGADLVVDGGTRARAARTPAS